MTLAQWLATIRWLGSVLGGLLVARGLIGATELAALLDRITEAAPLVVGAISALVPIGSLVWSLFAHSTSGTIAAAAASTEVSKIVTTAALAKASDSSKVVSK